ncbi:MAG TPA: hypothetical protein VMK83_12090 [Gaiellaceae bacterium]|nr:hypothetical protein [Gaiellaceae bacterium]
MRVAAVAFLALVAAVVLAWPALVPLAAVLVGGLYGAELAIADEPLDVAAPAVAGALLLSVELAYWSLEERGRWKSDPGENLRRGAFVALLCVAALLVSALLLALVDTVRARGLALDLLGATAAAAVLVTVLVAARRQVRHDR